MAKRNDELLSTSLDAATAYAERGWRVLPVRPRSKVPALQEWQKRASTDSKMIQRWFRDEASNVGIATGRESGLLVLDVDGDHRKLLGKRELPDTAIQKTGGGGAQFFYSWDDALDDVATTRAGVLPSIDTRGAGGYVVAPPSTHPNRRRYAWLDGYGPDVKLAPPPQWLVDALRTRRRSERTPASEWRAIAGEGASEGSRNSTLARLSGHLFSRVDLDPDVARELLLAWSQARCTPPMDGRQALRTIHSIAERELAKWR